MDRPRFSPADDGGGKKIKLEGNSASSSPQKEYPSFGAQRQALNDLTEFPYESNPNSARILEWVPLPEHLLSRPFKKRGPATFIKSEEDFLKMMKEITKVNEIAVDLESHIQFSFLGMTIYIPISTEDEDFIIHVPSCHELIISDLKKVFEDEKISKIFHAAKGDILNLQRDFGIFPVGVVDTQLIHKFVYGASPLIGLKDMAKELLGDNFPLDWDSSCQMKDWREDPLPEDMAKYAQYESSMLLEVWQLLKEKLEDNHKKLDEDWKPPISEGNNEVSISYQLPSYEIQSTNVIAYGVEKAEDMELLGLLQNWRVAKAKEVDESLNSVVDFEALCKMARERPTNLAELRKCFRGHNYPTHLEVRWEQVKLLAIIMESNKKITL
ncbi:unnamed protein product [Orchesella dallaii]|uniref:HRDC domain-containing protein n=1 Tax=Orchesella dallaii TaxID=48710 RepID=A0ABP1R1C2_9HEXA